jgi:glycosyltransferase involved in cell wall biosynthesis
MTSIRILLLSRYTRMGASSRLRSYQYLPYLQDNGFEVIQAPLFGDRYLKGLYDGNISKFTVLYEYIQRVKFILKSRQFDMIWVEKEMLPWMPAWVELGLFSDKVPLVVDYDDAIFHKYDQHGFLGVRGILGKKIDEIMSRSDLVIVGNQYLFSRAIHAGAKRVELLPTVVDANRYGYISKKCNSPLTIGWIGQPSTAVYLKTISAALEKIISLHNARVVAVGPNPSQFFGLPIEVKSWSEETEAGEIQQFDIGIMPLTDTPWERGKCGYKLIQYMACGKPVIASPVGVNNEIVICGLNGYLANSHGDWCIALDELCRYPELRDRMGLEGRKIMEEKYSLQIMAPKLAALLHSVVKE